MTVSNVGAGNGELVGGVAASNGELLYSLWNAGTKKGGALPNVRHSKHVNEDRQRRKRMLNKEPLG